MGFSPSVGRFIERDPLGYVDGMDDYEIEASNPVINVDPTGLATYTPDLSPEGQAISVLYDQESWDRAQGYTFAADLLDAFIKKQTPNVDAFEKYAGVIKADPDYRSAALKYFKEYIIDNNLGKGTHKLPDADASKKAAFDHGFYGATGPVGQLGWALGTGHFGYSNASITVDCTAQGAQNTHFTVNATMEQFDDYSFGPSSITRMAFSSYAAGNFLELAKPNIGYHSFNHRETWEDTFSGWIDLYPVA